MGTLPRKDERIERLEKLVAAFKQAAFGRKSEKSDPDQFDLALEDLETAMAAIHAEDEADAPAGTRMPTARPTLVASWWKSPAMQQPIAGGCRS